MEKTLKSNSMDNTEQKGVGINFRPKDVYKMPPGAKVISKKLDVCVQEIENGFIVKKSYDIKFECEGREDYMYYCKKVFSKTNPVEFKEDKNLASYFK